MSRTLTSMESDKLSFFSIEREEDDLEQCCNVHWLAKIRTHVLEELCKARVNLDTASIARIKITSLRTVLKKKFRTLE